MAKQIAITDESDHVAGLHHSGTAETAETIRSTGRPSGAIDVNLAEAAGAAKITTNDVTLIRHLESINTQLKIMNVHLSRMTDEELNETDIPKGVI